MIRAAVSKYLETSTAHGVPYLNSKSLHKRLSWAVFLILAVTFFSIHVSLLVSRYLEYDVITQWATPPGRLPDFPRVLLCHAAPYSLQRTKMIFTGNISFKQVILHNLQAFWKVALNQELDTLTEYNRDWNLLTRLSLQPYAFNWNISHQAHDVVVECFYNNAKCSSDNFTAIWFPYHNHCFSFRPVDPTVFHNHKTAGLSLILHTKDRRGYLTDAERLHWFHGYYVTLVNDGHLPDPDRTYIEASTGHSTTISFSQTIRRKIKSSRVRCVETSNSIDMTHHDEHGNYGRPVKYTYDSDSCRMAYNQYIYLSHCGCFSDHYLIPADHIDRFEAHNITWCHHIPNISLVINNGYALLNQTVFINASTSINLSLENSVFQKLRANHQCWQNINTRLNRMGPNLDFCHEPCESTEYHTTTYGHRWPSSISYERSLQTAVHQAIRDARSRGQTSVLETLLSGKYSNWNESLQSIQSTFLLLNIHSADTHVLVAEESLVYPVRSLLSDFGGTLGLWVGCSIISIIEIGWFIGVLVVKWCTAKEVTGSINNNLSKPFKPQPWLNIVTNVRERPDSTPA